MGGQSHPTTNIPTYPRRPRFVSTPFHRVVAMLRHLLCAALATVVLPVTSIEAQGLQEVSYTSTIVEEATNWTHVMDLQRFDPALGSLQTVAIRIEQTVRGRVRIESTDATPAVVQSDFESFLAVVLPDGNAMQMPIPMANYQDTFTAFDGTVDFAGTSGITHQEIVLTQALDHPLPPSIDETDYMGPPGAPGFLPLSMTALGLSAASGAGNVITEFALRASATITITYGFIGNTPPTFTTCTSVVMASVGVPLTFQVCAFDSDSTAPVTLTSTALPAGATLSPVLPTSGNPVCTTLTWTPTSSQIGSTSITFTATDANQATTTCQVNIVSAECHLVLGFGLGQTQQWLFGHLFDTQLSSIRRAYPVTMEDMPALPYVNLPTNFFAQVVMHNPEVFPTNPDQWSQVLRVTKDPVTDLLRTLDLGTHNGMQVFAEDFYDAQGIRRVRFPFTIEGM